MTNPNTAWLYVPHPNPRASLRLFCFPYAGGNVSIFRSWPDALPPSVELCGVRRPRVGQRLHTQVRDLVEEFGPALLSTVDKPFAFFGHSLGAVIAFETARWLRRRARLLPRHLYVSGRRSPHLPDLDPPLYVKDDDELVQSLAELNATPPEILADREMLNFLLPAIRADFQMGETYEYVPESPLACPITVFAGKDDEETVADRLDGWRSQTSTLFSTHTLDGDHFFIHSQTAKLLELLQRELERIPVH